MKRKKWKHCYWYDPQRLALGLCRPDEELVFCKYFTARVANNPGKQKRQSDYLDALGACSQAEIFWGRYKDEEHTCTKCFEVNKVPKEKMTDVNIAVEILRDAFEDKWDRVVLVSGDSDLVPPFRAVRDLFPKKERMIAWPPDQFTSELGQLNSGQSVSIGRMRLEAATLPEEVTLKNGYVVKRPDRWVLKA